MTPLQHMRIIPAALAAILFAAAAFFVLAPLARHEVQTADVKLAAAPDLGAGYGTDFPELVRTTLARPLFVRGRSAAIGESGDSAALGDMRLAGTIANARIRKALFAVADPSSEPRKGRWLGVGEEIAGWRIQTIDAGVVVLARGGERATLALSKRRALTPKQISQARAATPILSTSSPSTSKEAIEKRAESIRDALSRLDQNGLYGSPE